MRKIICIFIMACLLAVSLVGCNEQNIAGKPAKKGSVEQNAVVFPRRAKSFVGDPIPFFDGEKMNVFYIHDARNLYDQFHPWYLYQTDNFYEWEDKGNVIPSDGRETQDWGIGTGTVLKDKNGLYHAFYTGWNGEFHLWDLPYNEKVQHATSTDLVNWKKIPEDGFFGGNNEFRDPHVVWVEEEQCYWMLVSTYERAGSTKGVLRRYKSTDLKTWQNFGTYFDDETYFMECPTLIQFNGYWYLSYFTQAPNGTSDRMVKYLYKKNLSDAEWIRPERDYFDGAGFSSGKFEKYFDRLVMIGWNGTKTSDYDGGEYTWAGNLVTHEMIQNADGTLCAQPVKEVAEKIGTEVEYDMSYFSKGSNFSQNKVTFGDDGKYQYVLFDDLEEKPTKMTFNIVGGADKNMGMTFGRSGGNSLGELSILFDLKNGELHFYNKAPSNLSGEPQAKIKIKVSDNMKCTVLSEGECVTVYLDDEVAFTSRIYALGGKDFGFFSESKDIVIDNLHFYE